MSPRRSIPTGFTLIELMVALVVLGLIVLPLSGMAYQAAQRSHRSTQSQFVAGAVTAETGRLSVIQYDSLPGTVGCVSVTTPPFPHDRCTTVVDVSPTLRQITLIITPTAPLGRPDTVVFDRARPAKGNPFKTL